MSRITSLRVLVHILLFLTTAAAVALLTSCGGSNGGQEAVPTVSTSKASHPDVYVLRGEVKEVPDPNDPLSGFYVHHEALAGFKSIDGKVVGMDSMTMPFPVADDLSFAGISVGDPVEFTLEVDWEGDPAMQVTSIKKLPEGTRLDFGRSVDDSASTPSEARP